MKDMEVDWYSGKELYTHPTRIKINGIWEEVFHYEKIIREDTVTKKREIIFRCHIGDNRTIEITVPSSK
jgi:hypothetical protein